jgi:hypothetical protein
LGCRPRLAELSTKQKTTHFFTPGRRGRSREEERRGRRRKKKKE